MDFNTKYKSKELVDILISKIYDINKQPVKFMEVCGSHTMAIRKNGLNTLLPENISLISGPGCPVCVTSISYINQIIKLSKEKNIIIATYGDLIRVPGSKKSLAEARSEGADIRIVYSTTDALNIARENAKKELIFLGIGFETTAPATAMAVLLAEKEKINNFSVFSAHKIMPPAMEAIIDEGININGYIAPGHVTTIGGANMYKNLFEKYKIPIVISGFEPVDILQSIYMLVKQIETNDKKIEIQYKRVVTPEGNRKAQKIMYEVFETSDSLWRGLGNIRKSGLVIKEKYAQFDAQKKFNLKLIETKEPQGCQCGNVLKGLISPLECPLFSKVCNPDNPVGACMVSSEGACHTYFLFN